jgi:type III pantothenate kinase
MRLLIDVGNTSLKAKLWHNAQVQECDVRQLPWQQITAVIYACVGRSELLHDILSQAAAHNVSCFAAQVTKSLGVLHCAYEHESNLGIDRWLALIASVTLYPKQACIVVDAGTATTIDVVNRDGQHLGGWILPGLDLMTHSLTQNTQRVFDDNNTPFTNQLGKNTPNGLKNGALVATIGAIEQAKPYLNDKNAQIIFAGGYGALLQQQFSQSFFDPQLVIKGLNYWYELSESVKK